jgi:SAM-dependent methyltransferase
MRLGYTVRASRTMLRHPRQGVERVRGRIDRHRDNREWRVLGIPAGDAYGATTDWGHRLHAALGLPWPCPAGESFGNVWDGLVAELTASGVRVGMRSYGGWNDGDRAFAEAIWCIVAHTRPRTVIETGVAHGVTSRVILEALERHGTGHLWSIDLPAVDSALHPEIGIAVPKQLRFRWTYLSGTSRERLPHLLTGLHGLDLFVHDSLHTGRNLRFELESAWAVLRPGGVVVADDIDHSLGFRAFVDLACPTAWLAARHVTGAGLWGVAINASNLSEPAPRRLGSRAPNQRIDSIRERRHERLEHAVVREIARAIKTLARGQRRLLEIDAGQGLQTLLFHNQLDRPERPVIYDREDLRGPGVRPKTDFARVDIESAVFPAPDDHFDLIVWNRDLVTVKNVGSALQEVGRVLRPRGVLVVAIPNLAALHNRLLLLVGRQPTTLHINNGDHVRGFAIASTSRFLKHDLGFRILRIAGVGLPPITGAGLPRPLRGLSHTVVWVLRKPDAVATGLQAGRPATRGPAPSEPGLVARGHDQ